MTNLAAFWQAEAAVRAARAGAAVVAGAALPEAAVRDAQLCALVAAAIDSGFVLPALHQQPPEINDHADAAELVATIARKARLDYAAANPTPPDLIARRRTLDQLERRIVAPVAICLAAAHSALEWQARARGRAALPEPLTTRWRIPLAAPEPA